MATIGQWVGVVRSLAGRRRPAGADVALLDVAMGSENAGDRIIMDACEAVCGQVFPNRVRGRFATHHYSPEIEGLAGWLKVLCGTNILHTHMGTQRQWALPHDLGSYRNTVLLGVGMSDIGIDDPIDAYTRCLYRALLAPDVTHSVRDGLAERRLREIGITNVVNTSCPTMWGLTERRLARVPARRQRSVLTSVTDYCFSAREDREMLGILRQLYEHVVIWVQGSHDVDWCLSTIVDLSAFEVIGPDIAELNAFVARREFDYVGTRLHAGIRCLDAGHRSLVVAVDNRARAIAADTGLPVIERARVWDGAIEEWVTHPERPEIVLPSERIDLWRSQFRSRSRRP